MKCPLPTLSMFSRRAAPVAAALALAGCGVGVGIEIHDDDDPPSVSTRVSPAQATAGQALRLTADADDDWFVDEVTFYRIESDGRSTQLCRDRSRDYDCNTQVPAGTPVGTVINFYARAEDNASHTTDSRTVSVTVVANTVP